MYKRQFQIIYHSVNTVDKNLLSKSTVKSETILQRNFISANCYLLTYVDIRIFMYPKCI